MKVAIMDDGFLSFTSVNKETTTDNYLLITVTQYPVKYSILMELEIETERRCKFSFYVVSFHRKKQHTIF